MRHWTKSYDITYVIYNADLEWHATLNKVIWHHMWHLSATQKSHVTSYDVVLVSYDITCDMYTGLACVTAIVLYIHDICFIQSINKPARLHITGGGGGGPCQRRAPSCHVTSKWHHMTSHVTFGCRPKGMMSRMVWKCDVIWHQNDITWCHMRLLGSRMRHEQMSYDITCDIGRRLKCHIWHHMTSCDMTCAVYRCCFSPSKLFMGALCESSEGKWAFFGSTCTSRAYNNCLGIRIGYTFEFVVHGLPLVLISLRTIFVAYYLSCSE